MLNKALLGKWLSFSWWIEFLLQSQLRCQINLNRFKDISFLPLPKHRSRDYGGQSFFCDPN